jgi:hypothetical protein
MNAIRRLWSALTSNGCKGNCQQGDVPCTAPGLCYPDKQDRAPIDLESIAAATRWLERLIVALLLIVAAGFVAAALRGAL